MPEAPNQMVLIIIKIRSVLIVNILFDFWNRRNEKNFKLRFHGNSDEEIHSIFSIFKIVQHTFEYSMLVKYTANVFR